MSRMPVVHVHLGAGRSAEARRALLDAVADAVEATLDIPRDRIRVLLHEVAPEDFLVGDRTIAERDADPKDGA